MSPLAAAEHAMFSVRVVTHGVQIGDACTTLAVLRACFCDPGHVAASADDPRADDAP